MQKFKSKKAAIDYLKWNCRLFGNEKTGFQFMENTKLEKGEVISPRYFVIRYEDGFGFHMRTFYLDTYLEAPIEGRVNIKPVHYVENKKRCFKIEVSR